jgi:hypothetical protein
MGRLIDAGDFADVLQGSGADFVGGDGGIEVEEDFYVSAHGDLPVFFIRLKQRVFWLEGLNKYDGMMATS